MERIRVAVIGTAVVNFAGANLPSGTPPALCAPWQCGSLMQSVIRFHTTEDTHAYARRGYGLKQMTTADGTDVTAEADDSTYLAILVAWI